MCLFPKKLKAVKLGGPILVFAMMFTGPFPSGSDGKASAYNVGDLGSIPGSGRSPGEGNGNPLQLLLLGKSHGQRSLVGYSPQDRNKSDTTEQLHFLLHGPLGPSFSITAHQGTVS